MPKKSFYKQSAKVEAASTTTVLEVAAPSKFIVTDEPALAEKKSFRWGWWLLSAGLLTGLLLLVLAAFSGWWYWHTFERATQVDLSHLAAQFWQVRSETIFHDKPYVTIMLLGLDQSTNQRETSLLTDTMMASVLQPDGSVHMISLPRDLWIDSLKTRVNALYYYGQQTDPTDGVALVNSVMTEITGVPIDYYLIVNMDTVKQVIDAIGGLDITVARSFTDTFYPREIDLTSKDPAVLYETIRFEAGINHMDGATALKFIRSRHSSDEFEGTDEGREQRQQLVLQTLKQRLLSPSLLLNPTKMGALYRVWKTSIKTNLSDVDMFLMAKSLARTSLSLQPAIIPVKDSTQAGIIYHPVDGPSHQWVYLPVDPSWEEFHHWFQSQF